MFTTHPARHRLATLTMLALTSTLLMAQAASAQRADPALPKLTDVTELNLREGESMRFCAAQVRRLGIEHSALLRASGAADTFELTGVKVGLTTLTLALADDTKHSLYVRVARATSDAIIASALRTGAIKTSARCLMLAKHEASEVTLRLTLNESGEVGVARLDAPLSLSQPVQRCLVEEAKSWRFQVEPKSPISVALITLSTAK